MKRVSLIRLLLILTICSSNTLIAQVIQKQANRHQLINGVKLESKHSRLNLVKINATSVKKVNNLQNTQLPKKDKKSKKILKYRNKRTSKNIKKEDD